MSTQQKLHTKTYRQHHAKWIKAFGHDIDCTPELTAAWLTTSSIALGCWITNRSYVLALSKYSPVLLMKHRWLQHLSPITYSSQLILQARINSTQTLMLSVMNGPYYSLMGVLVPLQNLTNQAPTVYMSLSTRVFLAATRMAHWEHHSIVLPAQSSKCFCIPLTKWSKA